MVNLISTNFCTKYADFTIKFHPQNEFNVYIIGTVVKCIFLIRKYLHSVDN